MHEAPQVSNNNAHGQVLLASRVTVNGPTQSSRREAATRPNARVEGRAASGAFLSNAMLGCDSYHSTLAIWEWNPCRSGKGGPVLGRNSVKSGRKADIMKFPSLLFPFNQALIYCYFPWYLVARTMAKVEYQYFGYLASRVALL